METPFLRKWHPIPEVQFFVITGTGRSELSWLSTLLSYGKLSLCLHEPKARGLCIDSFQKTHTYVGIAEPALHMIDYCLVKRSRAVFITRPYQDTLEANEAFQEASYDAYQRSLLKMADEKLGKMIEAHAQKLVVDFESLREYQTVEHIWNFCIPCTPLPHEWFMECKRKHIESFNTPHSDPELDHLLSLILNHATT